MEECEDDVCRNTNEREQESVDEKWKELVQLTTTENLAGRTATKIKRDRDTWWWAEKIQEALNDNKYALNAWSHYRDLQCR